MSSSHNHIPPLPVRERAACMCVHGEACSSFAPGHAVHLIQARLASATPAEWIDAVVADVDDDGWITVRTLDEGTQIVVWSGARTVRGIEAGTPVALHERYHVLSIGRTWLNVAPLV